MKELEPLIQREEQKEKKYKKLGQIKKYLKIYEKKFHFLLLILLLNVNLDLLFYHSPGYNALFSSLLFSSLLFSSLLFSSLLFSSLLLQKEEEIKKRIKEEKEEREQKYIKI